MTAASQLVSTIIREQEAIIGPLAWSLAKEVKGIRIQGKKGVILTAGTSVTIAKLVKHYQALFGPASLEVCREAARPIIAKLPKQEVPNILR